MKRPFPAAVEPVDSAAPGVLAFTTTRERGDFNLSGAGPTGPTVDRWIALQQELGAPRFAHARQVHGTRVVLHGSAWHGLLRIPDADGHLTSEHGTALAVTLADCIPVFLSHPGGAVALLHAGWRGVAAGIVREGLRLMREVGADPAACFAHLGPGICGACYEVGPDVFQAVRGEQVTGPARLDLRAVLAEQLQHAGVHHVTVSPSCTRCHNERFFSHRAGDAARHIAVILRLA